MAIASSIAKTKTTEERKPSLPAQLVVSLVIALVVSKETFYTLDNLLWRRLWRWAKRRHPNKSSEWVKTKYFSPYETRNWILNKGKYVLNLHSDVPIIRYNKIRGNKSPA